MPRPAVVVNPQQQENIAQAYERAPAFDRRAVPAFKAMAEETGRQFDHLTRSKSKGGLGVNVNVHREDPYGASNTSSDPHAIKRMFSDISNGHMNVLDSRSTGGHPIFSDDTNNMFRAVHDYHGHYGSQRGFDAHGEEAAYERHSQMYSDKARPAMATETRGQNSAMNRRGGVFPEQKVAIIGADRYPISRQFQTPQYNDARAEHAKSGLL